MRLLFTLYQTNHPILIGLQVLRSSENKDQIRVSWPRAKIMLENLSRMVLLLWLGSVCHLGSASAQPVLDSSIVAGLEKGKYFILLRHALAPGTGDPDHFKLTDCTTQRNLSEQGRAQARQIGKLLKASGLEEVSVFSSQWCRCKETAMLLDYGKVTELPAINSFFRDFTNKQPQTLETLQWLRSEPVSRLQQPIILVSHQVNITALTGVFPQSGELLIVELDGSGKLRVVERIPTAY